MKKKGISLIVLIITIIVIIILAGAVILNLSKNNPIDSARKAKFLNDIDSFKSELSLYELGQMSSTDGNYDPKLLNADKIGSYENGATEINDKKKIDDIISSMKNTDYPDKLEVIAGELVYVGNSQKESEWSDGVIESKDFKIDISAVPDTTHISGTVSLSGTLVDIGKISYYKIYLATASGERPAQPSFETTSQSAKVDFNITEGVVPNQTYYIIVDLKMSNEVDVRTKEIKVVSVADAVKPNAPQISVPNYSKSLTITPVAITLTDNDGGSGINKTGSKYVVDNTSSNYSETDNIWGTVATNFTADNFIGNVATMSMDVSADGEYYIHVLSVDNSSNKVTATSSKIILDTTAPSEPTITIPSSTATNNVQATVAMSDNINGSGLDLINCKYIYSTASTPYGDTEAIWNNATVFTSATQTITLTSSTNEIYYLHVLLVDKAGNRREVLSSGVTTNTDTPIAPVVTGTVTSNAWTNGNVTLTVNTVASPGIVRYEYNINDGAWQTYNSTNKIIITTEQISYIKARAVNNVSVNGAESTGYIVRIDKTNPSVIASNGGSSGTNLIVNASASDVGGSGINASSYQYSKDDGITWTAATSATSYTFSNVSSGTYNCKVRVSDIAGNVGTSSTVSITLAEYPTSNTPGTEGNPGTPKNENTTINGKTPTYNNPVIPAGFSPVNTTDASWNLSNGIPQGWNNGLVIQDSYGNQFVWVPVDGSDVPYAKWCTEFIGYNDSRLADDTLPSGYNEYTMASKYKGFYIGRYEAAFDYNGGNTRVAVKKSTNVTTTNWSTTRNATYNGYLWNYIKYEEAKAQSESMASNYGYNSTYVGTNMVTGTQWDTALKWIQNSGKSVIDTRTWGNHQDSTAPANVSGYKSLQISGYSEYWKAKNIYDLAGNASEHTNELFNISPVAHINRSGSYAFGGSYISTAYRSYDDTSSWMETSLSFRVVLYIK